MRTFFLFSMVLFALLIGAAVTAGRLQPLPDRLAALHMSDCLAPCWIGIVPGITPLTEARKRIEARFGDPNGSPVSVFYNSGTLRVYLFDGLNQDAALFKRSLVGTTRDRIERIMFVFEPRITVAQAYVLLGAPVQSYLRDSRSGPYDYIALISDLGSGGSIIFVQSEPRLTFDQPASFILYYGQNSPYTMPNPRLMAWRGFASMARYGLEFW